MAESGEDLGPDAAEVDITPPPLTAAFIEERLGFHLAVTFPRFETDKVGVVSFHDELERLGRQLGWENVFGSLFYEGEELRLGVFVEKDAIPIAETAIPSDSDEETFAEQGSVVVREGRDLVRYTGKREKVEIDPKVREKIAELVMDGSFAEHLRAISTDDEDLE